VVDLSILSEEPIPGLVLVIGGVLSVAIAVYGQREDSHWDEIGTFFAFILGIAMFVIAYALWSEEAVSNYTLGVVIVLALTLFLKPMKEIPWSGVIGAVVGGVAAFAASIFLPSDVFGVDEWIILVVIFLVVGAIVHQLFHFLEDVLAIASMVLQWKPVMIAIGIVSTVEGALLLAGSSIFSFL
jgi:uncharacterized membrane protein YhaH (DUF805 family)